MKTTVEISPALLLEAKALSREQQISFKSLLEEGLRLALERRRKKGKPYQFRMPAAHLGQPLISSWDSVRELIYEGRGGSATSRPDSSLAAHSLRNRS